MLNISRVLAPDLACSADWLTTPTGEGEGDHAWTYTDTTREPASPASLPSFAPSRLFSQRSRICKRPPQPLKLDSAASESVVTQMHDACSVREFELYKQSFLLMVCPKSAIHSRLGWPKDAHFLEQFRYIIVASQLLSEHSHQTSSKRRSPPKPAGYLPSHRAQDGQFVPSPLGLSLTASTAFLLAWIVRWLHKKVLTRHGVPGILFLFLLFVPALTSIYAYVRRQSLHNLRLEAVKSASVLTTNMQGFDAVTSAGITSIQEIELVSRGYRM